MAILKLKQEDGSWAEVPALIGKNGKTPYIKDGYWWIGETNTNVRAAGTDGKTPYIKESYWWIGNTNTNVKAEGVDGTDGKTAYEYAQDGGYGGTEAQFTEKLANGFGGLHIGSSTPPDTADVWVNPNGEPTMVEEWEFDMDDGSVETKAVVVTESEDATSGRKAAILRVRQADGSFAEIPALKGKTAYEYAQEGGFTGTEEEFIALLLGDREYDASAITSGVFPLSRGGTGAATVEGVLLNLGLENVDNTSDAEKLISTATQEALDAKANKDEVPTKTSELTNDSDFATNASLNQKIAEFVDAAPEALDTLNELAAALGDDPDFATTIATELGKKANKTEIPSSLSSFGVTATAAELNYVKGVTSNIQTQLNGKLSDYTIEIYNGNKGNPSPVKFATVDYSTCDSENGVAIKISMVSGHGNGTSYAFLQDAIIRVNYQGAVSVDNFKYYGAAVTDGGVARQYGDIFWVVDTTNKIVDFYCLMGQYARVNMTPYKRLTYSSGGTVTQHKNATLYSSGEKVWANNSEIATLNDIPDVPTITKENWTFTLEDGSTVTKAVHVG